MKHNYLLKFSAVRKVFLIVFAVLTSMSVSAIDVTTGLFVYYSFDDVTESTVPDNSSNGYDATLFGAPVTNINGYNGDALTFTAKEDYMTLPTGVLNGLTNYSISTWVYLNSATQWSRILDFGSGTDNYLFITPKASSGYVRFAIKNGGSEETIDGTSALPTDRWVNVAFTYEYNSGTSTGTGKLFVDGGLVGTNPGMTLYPALLPEMTQSYVAKSQYDDPALNGSVDELRIYNRTLTPSDIMVLAGIPSELITEYNNLTETSLKSDGDLTNVTSNITLPGSSNSNVTITWASTNTSVIDVDGTVTRPQDYDATVKLTATLTQIVGGETHTMTKIFNVTVLALNSIDEQFVLWDFEPNSVTLNENGEVQVADEISGFVGTVMNDAKIRTIGEVPNQFNVLDLGDGKGYFDMGTEIGKAIYSLTNYTMAGYFRIDDTYSSLNSDGNFYWTFSNSDDANTDRNGYIIGSLKTQSQSVSSGYWGAGNQGVGANTNAPKGSWHHFAFVQNGTTGTVYVDGTQVAQNTAMTNYPSIALPKEGLTGTLYNWLGRSCYTGDVYLRKTLMYGFTILSVPMSQADVNDYFGVASTIQALDAAYEANPEFVSTALSTEANSLSLGDLSQVISNLTLPAQGTIDPNITITWKSSNPQLITDEGVVTRPDYYDYVDTLTATLFQGGQSVVQKFYATVLKNEGTEFTGNLLVRYDFSQVSDTTVTDVAEKHFKGTLEAGAKVITMGSGDTQYDVLSLGDSIGYFDMGKKVGQIMYNINDYTISAYYRIDNEYDKLSSDGNFLWNFSNSPGIKNTAATGYMIASLRNQANTISANNWVGEQTVRLASAALQGGWHNMTYVQKDTVGAIYIDGVLQASDDSIFQTPANTLPHEGNLGTIYNWIGRSCYETDVYLRNTLVYDLRVYDKALTEEEITNSELNVGEVLNNLEVAYALGTSLPVIESSKYKIATSRGAINILGLKGTENVSIFDISGKQLTVKSNAHITVEPGIYIVRINDSAQKVVVR